MPPQADLRLSSKAGIVIELNRFEPGFDVFAGFGMLAQYSAKSASVFSASLSGLDTTDCYPRILP
jgi:hypothetical protein